MAVAQIYHNGSTVQTVLKSAVTVQSYNFIATLQDQMQHAATRYKQLAGSGQYL